MKIAIPLFGTRISPRFDHTKKFLLVSAENGKIIERQELLTEGWTSLTRIKRLRELGVDTLICSGIDCFSARQLNFNGIRIYSWVTGEAEDALRSFLEGRLEPGFMMASDIHQHGRWRFKRGRLHHESSRRGQDRGSGQGKCRGQGRR